MNKVQQKYHDFVHGEVVEPELQDRVFASLGAAIILSQLIGESLLTLLVLSRSGKNKKVSMEEFEMLLGTGRKKTLGGLVSELRKAGLAPPNLDTAYTYFVAKRNYICHDFVHVNKYRLAQKKGLTELIEELGVVCERFQRLNFALVEGHRMSIEIISGNRVDLDAEIDRLFASFPSND